jgi:hypothetical protein
MEMSCDEEKGEPSGSPSKNLNENLGQDLEIDLQSELAKSPFIIRAAIVSNATFGADDLRNRISRGIGD